MGSTRRKLDKQKMATKCACVRACMCVRVGAVLVRACVRVPCWCVHACMRVCKLCTIRQGILTKGKGDESHFISFHGLNVDKSQEMINLNLYF